MTDDEMDQRDARDPLAALRRHGTDAVSFQGLESAMRWWRDAPPPRGTGAAIAYADTGGAWVAAGSPLVEPQLRAEAARRFIAASRRAHRRAAFACVEDVAPFDGFKRLPLGLQSILLPERWSDTLRAKPRLREQLRRARAKGVTIRRVDARELADGLPLRQRVDELRRQWLGSRRMEPMGFLVAVEPFHAPDEHLYLAAERQGIVVQFLSAVPIYARGGWLMEDMLRARGAPNGTTELLIDRLMQEARMPAAEMKAAGMKAAGMQEAGIQEAWMQAAGMQTAGGARLITPGLTPLAGRVPWWLALARVSMRPLYDFGGLERFRARLSPARWDPVWLVWDRGPAPLVLLDMLTAFADGRLIPFAWRSLVRHPSGPPWALALPLIPWTILLALLTVLGRASLLGFSRPALAIWTLFDAALAWLLFRAASRPTPRRLGLATAWAAIDAALSLQHLASAGIGAQDVSVFLRLVATTAPVAGCTALLWALRQAWRRASASP